jgi:hypothetical protein
MAEHFFEEGFREMMAAAQRRRRREGPDGRHWKDPARRARPHPWGRKKTWDPAGPNRPH